MHHMTYLQEAQQGGAGGLPLQKHENYDQKGGCRGSPPAKKNKDSEKGGAGVSPCKKRLKIFRFLKSRTFQLFPPNRKFSALFNQVEKCAKFFSTSNSIFLVRLG